MFQINNVYKKLQQQDTNGVQGSFVAVSVSQTTCETQKTITQKQI